ncbi:MAG TPA: 50S ribosomal protein L21, partial [Lacipirellulaceae bacterium]|nr:50S ribosomal protein L21 [Lacipirellulaceae bacterium]
QPGGWAPRRAAGGAVHCGAGFQATFSVRAIPMYAIISDGGRQLKVQQGEELTIDYRDVPAGEKLTFDRVLAVSDGTGDVKLGAPLVSGASVTAEVLGPEKGEKLVIQKLRRRKTYRRRTGHRSVYTRVRISAISG